MRSLVTLLAFLPLACGREEPPPAAPPRDALERFTLPADPGSAISVNDAKRKGPGDEVTVVGRLNRIVSGYAAFNLVDTSVPYCGELEGKKCCDKPWDYC